MKKSRRRPINGAAPGFRQQVGQRRVEWDSGVSGGTAACRVGQRRVSWDSGVSGAAAPSGGLEPPPHLTVLCHMRANQGGRRSVCLRASAVEREPWRGRNDAGRVGGSAAGAVLEFIKISRRPSYFAGRGAKTRASLALRSSIDLYVLNATRRRPSSPRSRRLGPTSLGQPHSAAPHSAAPPPPSPRSNPPPPPPPRHTPPPRTPPFPPPHITSRQDPRRSPPPRPR